MRAVLVRGYCQNVRSQTSSGQTTYHATSFQCQQVRELRVVDALSVFVFSGWDMVVVRNSPAYCSAVTRSWVLGAKNRTVEG